MPAKPKRRKRSARSGRYTAKGSDATTVTESADVVLARGYVIRKRDGSLLLWDTRRDSPHPNFPGVYASRERAESDMGEGETLEAVKLVKARRRR